MPAVATQYVYFNAISDTVHPAVLPLKYVNCHENALRIYIFFIAFILLNIHRDLPVQCVGNKKYSVRNGEKGRGGSILVEQGYVISDRLHSFYMVYTPVVHENNP